MKKIFAILLSMVMLISLVGCGGVASKKNNLEVNIDKLQSAIKKTDKSTVVQKTENENGYTFSYKQDSFYTTTNEGTADSNEMLISIVATATLLM